MDRNFYFLDLNKNINIFFVNYVEWEGGLYNLVSGFVVIMKV